jgi:CheY-like chemotaxis protein
MNAARRQSLNLKRSLSILVADDEPDTVRTLEAILLDEGHTVHAVTHGALVLEAVRRFKPEVCILDIEMPAKNGYALVQEILAAPDVHPPLLIAISGKWKTQTDKLLAKAVGFDHFFEKPADPNAVIAVLDEMSGPEAA